MSDIKSCFPSRWESGVLLESDFSQLEVIGLAALSQDPVLIEDLLSGRDMHTYFTAKRLKIEEAQVQPKQRTFTKRMTFQLQYGSGAKNMALKLRLPADECKAFIDEYYNRYAGVKAWQNDVMEAVYQSRIPGEVEGYGKGHWDSPTGRLYTFFEQDPPEWMKDRTPNFSPTQIKNYPVQGSATADIMAVFRARHYRVLLSSPLRGMVLPINTVHDSLMCDCISREAALEAAKLHKGLASQLQDVMMETWGWVCPVPFKIESKIGPKWSELEKVSV